MSEADEQLFLQHLRKDGDIRLIRNFASRPDELFINNLPPRSSREMSFWIWNASFPWKPSIAPWGKSIGTEAEISTGFRLIDCAGAPLIEYSREAFGNPTRVVHGRIYWNTWFALYEGAPYDQREFSRWFNRIVSWIRKNGERFEVAKGWSQFWLPGALEIETPQGIRRVIP